MMVTVRLSFKSLVLPETWREICTVASNVPLTSQLGLVTVSVLEVRPVTVPVATARAPGDGVGAPGLGQTPPAPRPPPKPPVTLPPRAVGVWPVVFALTLLCPRPTLVRIPSPAKPLVKMPGLEYLHGYIRFVIFRKGYVRHRRRDLGACHFDPGAAGRAAHASLRACLDDAGASPGRVHPAQFRLPLPHGRRIGAKRLDRAHRARKRRPATGADHLPAHRFRPRNPCPRRERHPRSSPARVPALRCRPHVHAPHRQNAGSRAPQEPSVGAEGNE